MTAAAQPRGAGDGPVQAGPTPTRRCASCGQEYQPRRHASGYCSQPVCQRARIRGYEMARARAAGVRPRPVGTCEGCGGPYRPVVGVASVGALCSRPACRLERRRRVHARRRQVVAGLTQPCGACNLPVLQGSRRPGTTWWHRTTACQAERQRRKTRGLVAQRRPVGLLVVSPAVDAAAAARVRLRAVDEADAALLLEMLGLAPAGERAA